MTPRAMRILPWLALLLVVSCVAEFRHPLPPPDPFRPDPQLLGSWAPAEATEGELILFQARASGWMDVVYLSNIGDVEGLDVEAYEAYSTSVGKDSFLCLRPRPTRRVEMKTGDEAGDYLLAHYRIRGKRMSLWLFSQPKIEALVQAGTLAGTVHDDGAVTVDTAADQLAALVAELGVDAFIDRDDIAELVRVKR